MDIRVEPIADFKILSHSFSITASDPCPAIEAVAWAGVEPEAREVRVLPILSRLPHRTQADEAWLGAIRRCIGWAKESGFAVAASAGLLGWEYSAWLAARSECRLYMVLPPMGIAKLSSTVPDLIIRLRLDPDLTTFLSPVAGGGLEKSERLQLRDRLAFALAQIRLPIAVRKRGFWETRLAGAAGVDQRFQTNYPPVYRERWSGSMGSWSWPSLDSGDGFLVHWTRGSYGPWPGEVEADYFTAITEAGKGNPRDGMATLSFMVRSGILRGRGAMVKGGVPMISFMEPPRGDLTRMFRWRPALCHWNYEPYGIAIPKPTLVRLGIRPVIYGSKERFETLSDEERPFYQYEGSSASASSWRDEREWRLPGDLDLNSLQDQVRLLAPTPEEAVYLQEATSYRAISLSSGGRPVRPS